MSDKFNEIMDKINKVDDKFRKVNTSVKMGVANIKLSDPVSKGLNGVTQGIARPIFLLAEKGPIGYAIAGILATAMMIGYMWGITSLGVFCMNLVGDSIFLKVLIMIGCFYITLAMFGRGDRGYKS